MEEKTDVRERPQYALCPYLVYEDERAAIEWLDKAFGFRVRELHQDADGRIVHCELELGRAVVGVGGPTPAASSPRALAGHYTSSLYVLVDDVDAHYERARSAGAEILRPLEDRDFGERTYGCLDLEGHPWFFGAPIERSTK
jgi:uncharacterized glyoxalase superfamily protein PhnB